MDTLTKENFWDEMEQKYPKAIAHLKSWIDQYKSKHNWNTVLFNHDSAYGEYSYRAPEKYHELPIAMQFGIFLEYLYYCKQNLKLSIGVAVIKGEVPFYKSVRDELPSFFKYMEDKL